MRHDGQRPDVSGLEILQAVLLPVADEHSLPLALGLADDSSDAGGLVVASASVLQRLLAGCPQIKFIIVVDGSVPERALALARKHRNAHLVLRKPSRHDLDRALGAIGCVFSVTSGRELSVLEELAGEWRGVRRAVTGALTERYTNLVAAGWTLSRAEIASDAQLLLGGALENFIAR